MSGARCGGWREHDSEGEGGDATREGEHGERGWRGGDEEGGK